MADSARLTFHPDWGIELSGPIHRGGRLEVVYAPARVPACRASGWAVTVHYFFAPFPELWFAAEWDGGQTQTDGFFPVKSLAVPPTATAVVLWFVNTDRTGCVSFDSDYGANFQFPVGPSEE